MRHACEWPQQPAGHKEPQLASLQLLVALRAALGFAEAIGCVTPAEHPSN